MYNQEISIHACIRSYILRSRLQKACTPDKCGLVTHLTFSFQILIRTRATDLDARMYDGSTALILAARLAVEGMVEELITCHADVNAVDELGKCTYTLTRFPPRLFFSHHLHQCIHI